MTNEKCNPLILICHMDGIDTNDATAVELWATSDQHDIIMHNQWSSREYVLYDSPTTLYIHQMIHWDTKGCIATGDILLLRAKAENWKSGCANPNDNKSVNLVIQFKVLKWILSNTASINQMYIRLQFTWRRWITDWKLVFESMVWKFTCYSWIVMDICNIFAYEIVHWTVKCDIN